MIMMIIKIVMKTMTKRVLKGIAQQTQDRSSN